MKLIDHYLSLEQIVSDTDSFLQEVSEELRRDRLYRNIRKYGWLAILLVVLVVGGATYREYLKSKAKLLLFLGQLIKQPGPLGSK